MKSDLRSTYLKVVAASAGIALCVFVALAFYETENVYAVSPAASDDIPAVQVAQYEAQAQKGDCEAAGRLARFHGNVTLNYDESVKWTRIAAKCPGLLFHKEMLLGMYLYEGQQPADAGEIERLLAEIEAAAPESAAHYREKMAGMSGK